MVDLAVRMENLFDRMVLPAAEFRNQKLLRKNRRRRCKGRRGGTTGHVRIKTADAKPNEKATFIVQVQFRQNATWQGTITWRSRGEEDAAVPQRLELIKLG